MAGSSIVAGTLYSSLSAIFLIVPLNILPDLVFGNLFITITFLNAATGPMLSLTIFIHSFEIVSLSFYLITFVVDKIPIAIVYATWSGLGVFTVAILGYIFFKQSLSWQAVLGLFFIVFGVVLVNSFSVKTI